MNYMKKLALFLLFGVGIISCKSDNTQDYIEYSFIPEIYPYTDTTYANHLNTIPFFLLGQEKHNKLIFYINGDCSVCFARIIEWQKFVSDNIDLLNKKQIKTALVIFSEQLDILEYNLEKIPNSLPIYIDTAQYFSTFNNIPLSQTTITLLDSNNIVKYTTSLSSGKNYYKNLVQTIKREK